MTAWTLAIDFGTSYTVAAVKAGDRAPEIIEIDGERRMPSVVMIEANGEIVVGRAADDLSGTNPARTLRALKSRLGDHAPVVLDGRPYQVVNLVSAVLTHVYAESVRHVGEAPNVVRLTHPATWNRPRLNRLLEAAAKAGLRDADLVPEPVAAALSFAVETGVSDGERVAVYDLGGGTFDTAVVAANQGGFAIVGRPSGDQHIGGELFDELIVNHLGEQLPDKAWDAIQVGEDPLWRQIGATLRNEARKAKESLSGNRHADMIVALPTGLEQMRLTRETFERLVRPYVSETVVLLQRCVQEAGVAADRLAGVSLVGGSSRSQIVQQMVSEAFPDVPVIRRGDPKTAVAAGAARAVRPSDVRSPPVEGRTTKETPPTTARDDSSLDRLEVSVPPLAPIAAPIVAPLPSPQSPTYTPSMPVTPLMPAAVNRSTPGGSATPGQPFPQRHNRRLVALGGIGVAILLIGAAIAFVLAGKTDNVREAERDEVSPATEVSITDSDVSQASQDGADTTTLVTETASSPIAVASTTVLEDSTTPVADTVTTLLAPPESLPVPASLATVPGVAPTVAPGAEPQVQAVSATVVRPDSTDNCANVVSYSPSNAFDGRAETAWMAAGDGTGELLTITLTEPAIVNQLGLVPGYAKIDRCDPDNPQDRFFQLRRITSVRWTFDDGNSVEQLFDTNSGDLQYIALAAGVATSRITLQILGTTEPGLNYLDNTPISEIAVE